MLARIILNKLSTFFLANSIFFFIPQMAFPENPTSPPWQRLESKHAIIQYQKSEDLVDFNNNLEFGQENWSLDQLFSDTETESFAEEIGTKVDSLYKRVQEILDMRKQSPKVFINIYSSRQMLNHAYFQTYHKKNNIRAWYIFENNTIYINVNDMHEGMLAHEMAHAIIDHFLLIRPPAASAEILARYVDTHIHK